MLASVSEPYAAFRHRNPDHFLIRQVVWMAVALAAGAVASRIDYHRWREWWLPLVLGVVVLLGLCFVPGIGLRANNSRRWIGLGFASFQPSELAKFAVVVFLASWIRDNRRHVGTWRDGILVPMGVLSVVLLLIFVEPDYGTTMLISTVGLAMLFFGGTRIWHIGVVGAALGALFSIAVAMDPERLARLLAFLHPERYAQTDAAQLLAGLRAFSLGGPFGVGVGNGVQKMLYLPEAHTDFIFPVIGEEMGLPMTLLFVALYWGIFACGMAVTAGAPDTFGRLLAFGLTLMFTMQALINLGVVTGLLPTKGIALPLVSYGGSALLGCGLMMGTLLNIARRAARLVPDEHLRPIRDAVSRV